MTTKLTLTTPAQRACTCPNPCRPKPADADSAADGHRCKGHSSEHEPFMATVDDRGVMHMLSRASDAAFWLRCGIEL